MSNLTDALNEVIVIKSAEYPDYDELDYDYEFTADFWASIRKISQMAGHTYVSIGVHRVRKAVAIVLLAAILMAMAGCAVLIKDVIIKWNESYNAKMGAVDITFDIVSPDGEKKKVEFIKPVCPEGYTVIKEEQHGTLSFEVIYKDDNGHTIYYLQKTALDTLSIEIDSDDNSLSGTTINGHKGYKYSRNMDNYLYWSDGYSMFQIGGNSEMDLLMDMSSSLEDSEKNKTKDLSPK